MTQLVLTVSNSLNISGLLEWFRDMYRAYRKGAERRAMRKATLRELRNLTDHELRDLGIGRSDIIPVMNFSTREPDEETNSNLKGWV